MDLIVLLLHNTKDMELNTPQLFFRTKKWHWDIALFAASVRKNAVHETNFQFLLGVWLQHDLQGIYEGQKKIFRIPEADTEYWRSVTLFEDSNVPKADVFASVIDAETLHPTWHAADLNYHRAYLLVQRPGSNWLRFSSY